MSEAANLHYHDSYNIPYLPLTTTRREKEQKMPKFKQYLEQVYKSQRSALAQQRFRQIAYGHAEAGLTAEQQSGTIRMLQLGANWG